ncbi:MAG: hypothetical protein EOO45_27365 [Flavobacterium sp.]|nr:MAG: hypothetical protein EOO45_27365 [Flavobacterium sp.]
MRYSFDIYGGAVRRLQGDDYYAFGLRRPVAPVSLDNRYLYNGKELQEHLGQYDYSFRYLLSFIGVHELGPASVMAQGSTTLT